MLPALRPAILLVDDDPTLLSVLARRLTREGFDVRTAASGQAALAALDRSWPAQVVVDVMMPGMDGFELCRRIKRIADLPIIVLSAVQEYAEDYIVKPFDPDELVARVQRIMRRASTGRGEINLDGGELEIDLVHRRVTNRSGTQPLTPTEVRVLQVMIGSLDRTVPTETLLERVWSEADGADPSYVWVSMRRLRRKMEIDPDNPRYLLTERGIGYRLISSTMVRSDLEAGSA